MPDQTLTELQSWTRDDNVDVRRLASEGTRPTLPWGIQLPQFLNDPSHTYPILDALKDDKEEYVRRSVANHLNDLSKKHVIWFNEVAERWLENASSQRVKLVRHASRTLFKAGNPKTLELFGYKPCTIASPQLLLSHQIVQFGDGITFEFAGRIDAAKQNANSDTAHNLMVDYVIYHQKANGTLSPKVLKWKTQTLRSGETFVWKKFHAIKPITTRKYYSGEHRLEVLVNGVSIASAPFVLSMGD